MAGPISFVLQFQSGTYSPSERHYLVGINSVTDANGQARALAFATARVQLLGSGVNLTAIEMHDDSNLRSTIQVPVPQPPAAGSCYNPAFNNAYQAGEGNITDFSYSDLMCRKEAAVGGGIVYHSTYYVQGNPDVVQRTNVFPIADAVWLPAFTQFVRTCFGGPGNAQTNYGMKVLDRSNASPTLKVTGVTLNAGNQFVVAYNGDLGLQAGNSVKITGVKGNISSQINGVRFAGQPLAAGSFTVTGLTAPAGWTYKTGGTVAKRLYTVVAYTNLLQSRQTHRKRGASGFGVRGRRFAHRSTST